MTALTSCRRLVLERDFRSQAVQVAPDGRYGEPLSATPIRDGTVARGRVAVDFQAIPMFRMADVIDARIVVLAPEERYGLETLPLPENISRGDRTLFEPLLNRLLDRDDYMLMADFPSYAETQRQVADAYRDRERWTRMSILNSARSGKFSSDRSIREYCQDIWRIGPVSIEVK